MKLFVFYIGGDAPGSMIELHDMRIIAARTMMDCIPEIKKTWWGIPERLHLDGWGELTHAHGYDIVLKPEPFTGPEKLWFLNLGGYVKGEFEELHKNIFIVAEREVQARAKALKQTLHWDSHHKDTQFEVEKILNLETITGPQGLHIHLTPNVNGKPFTFGHGYKPIGKKGYIPDFGMAISLRQLGADEWQLFKTMRLLALQSDAHVYTTNNDEWLTKSDAEWQKMLEDNDSAIFGVFDGEYCIGITCIGIHWDSPDKKIGLLWGTWLKPEYRGKGISKQLYETRLNWARQHPTCEKLVVGHRAGNMASERANQKHGFIYMHSEERRWGDGADDQVRIYELNLNK